MEKDHTTPNLLTEEGGKRKIGLGDNFSSYFSEWGGGWKKIKREMAGISHHDYRERNLKCKLCMGCTKFYYDKT